MFLSTDGGRNLSLDSILMGLPMSDPTAWATAMNNLGMAPMGMTGQPLLPGELSLHCSLGAAMLHCGWVDTHHVHTELCLKCIHAASDLFRDLN